MVTYKSIYIYISMYTQISLLCQVRQPGSSNTIIVTPNATSWFLIQFSKKICMNSWLVSFVEYTFYESKNCVLHIIISLPTSAVWPLISIWKYLLNVWMKEMFIEILTILKHDQSMFLKSSNNAFICMYKPFHLNFVWYIWLLGKYLLFLEKLVHCLSHKNSEFW